MARTRGSLAALSYSRTLRQRASSARVPSDSPTQEATTEALQIPPSENGAPTNPFSSAPQTRYETRKPTIAQGATASRPQSLVLRPPAKKAMTSGPGESLIRPHCSHAS